MAAQAFSRIVIRAVGVIAVAVLASPGWLTTSSLEARDWTRYQDLAAAPDAATAEKLPVSWSPTEHQLWSAEITGYGQSSPVTWGPLAYVLSISGPQKERGHVTAIQIETGEPAWSHELATATQAENNLYVSRAAPSPTVDAAGVYCFFEGGNLLSLTHSGEVRWQRNLVEEYGPIGSRHGLSASLEQLNDRLFVWIERDQDPYVLCVDTSTGANVWKVPGMGATSWSSPRLLTVGFSQHLLFSAAGSVTGLDPTTGQRLWRIEGLTGNTSPTPIPAGNGRFVIGATVGRGEADNGRAAESNGLVAVTQNDAGEYTASFVWKAKRATCSFGSPAVVGGHAYFVNAAGVLFCLDLETGEEKYSQRLADSMWSTPVVVGDRLLFGGKTGVVSVVETGPEFVKLAENATWEAPAEAAEPPAEGRRGRGRFGGPTLYAIAVAGDRLLLRRGDRLFCIGQRTE